MAVSALTLSRVPDLLSSTLTNSQLETTQQQLAQVEQQISTGQLWTQPSDDPSNAAITMQLQRTLTQQNTYSTNLASSQSQLGEVDNVLGNVTTLIQQAQNIASTDVNSDVSDAERQSDSQVVDSIYNQILSNANTQFNGMYLFGGDKNGSAPYVSVSDGVQFAGSQNVLQNAVDTNTDMAFMVDGATVFGGSASQTSTTDLTPDLTAATRLNDLRGATNDGVDLGTIQISNGVTSALVDLSKANTVGDVINAINAAGVGGITGSISGQGITLTGAAGDNITVNDVGGDHTADDLGIAQTTGAGPGVPVIGSNANANVTEFTPLSALRGGAGIDPSGITINNGSTSAHISFAGLTTVGDLLNAINSSGTNVTASVSPSGAGIQISNGVQGSNMSISENGGTSAAELGVQTFNAQTPLSELNGGQGVTIAGSGVNDFSISTASGSTINVSLNGATTIQDVINDINTASGGAVTASFSTTSNGIQLVDTTTGTGTFAVSPINGSTAATQLGLTSAASGNTITGSDVNPVSPTGIFADLANLRTALQKGDQAAITAAAQGLQNDYNAAVQARGVAGAQVQEMQSRTDQITTQNTATQSLMSQLSDTDFTTAVTKFQLLQTSLQATLETAARTLNLSLVDFLS